MLEIRTSKKKGTEQTIKQDSERGKVGTVVASDTRHLRFESHKQFL